MMTASDHFLSPTLIEKENISQLVFPKEEVQLSKEERSLLRKKLKDAMILGNIHHNKIAIVFEDEEGLKEVRTTIWAAGLKFVVLKKGVSIPVHRIHSITI